jgi:hypothetical protein
LIKNAEEVRRIGIREGTRNKGGKEQGNKEQRNKEGKEQGNRGNRTRTGTGNPKGARQEQGNPKGARQEQGSKGIRTKSKGIRIEDRGEIIITETAVRAEINQLTPMEVRRNEAEFHFSSFLDLHIRLFGVVR